LEESSTAGMPLLVILAHAGAIQLLSPELRNVSS